MAAAVIVGSIGCSGIQQTAGIARDTADRHAAYDVTPIDQWNAALLQTQFGALRAVITACSPVPRIGIGQHDVRAGMYACKLKPKTGISM